MNPSKKIFFYLSRSTGIFLLVCLLIFLAFKVSVKPGVFIIRHLFNQPIEILDTLAFQKASAQVNKIENVSYPSQYKNNQLDIYYPTQVKKAKGILFWVHGGGFVAGDKYALEEFATYIAAENQIAVVAMNYETAPESIFPGQVKQVNEVFMFLQDHHAQYIQVDFSKILMGGDSAGGQIAGQYLALQTNKKYAEELQIPSSISPENLIGFIAYSAPVNLQQMKEVRSSNLFMKFFVNTVARAVLGTRKWQKDPKLIQASVAQHLTHSFPSTFITDGNTFSFQEQGQVFAEKLKTLNIPVEELFYADSEKEIPHEYQFNYRSEEAKLCLQKTIEFIDNSLKK